MRVEELITKTENNIENLRNERNDLCVLREVAYKLDFMSEVKYIDEKRVYLLDKIDIYKELLRDLTILKCEIIAQMS